MQLQPAQDAVRDAVGRVQRAERVLEDHRHVAAVGQRLPARRASPPAAVPGSGSRRRSAGRPGPAAGRSCSCRCRSRRPARRSRAAPMARSTSSTACSSLRENVAADLEVLGQPARLDQRRGHRRRAHPRRRASAPSGACSRQRAARRARPGRARARVRGSRRATTGQRGWKRQPAGGWARSGGLPGNAGQRHPRARGSRGTRRAARGCTGGRGGRTRSGSGPASTTWPGVHHQQLVGEVADQRHVVGDEDDREARAAAAAP